MSEMDPELAHLQKAPAEKRAAAVLPAAVAEWTAAEVMNLAGVHCVLPLGGATALAVALAWGAAGRSGSVPDSLPWWVAVAGGWLATADALGPLAFWPAPLLTFAWIAYAAAAVRFAHSHEAVTSAREWRDARAGWLEKRHRWHLGGTHLLDYQETERGEWYLISTKGTRKRASQLAGPALAELIAEAEDLPVTRVQVKRSHLAGRLEILVIRADAPWAAPAPHPLAAGGDPSALPVPWSVADGPAQVGASLGISLWGSAGGKNVNVVAIKGWGKTVVLNGISERVTAAVDAVQVRVNLSIKGHAEAERWGPSCLLTAFGPSQRPRAVRVLRAVSRVIEWRSTRYTTTFYEPSRKDPLIVVIVDEADSVVEVGDARKLLENLATKGREYGVTLVRAGQRGTNDYGSGKQKSQDDVWVTGAVNRASELRWAAGSASYGIPDMAALSEGNPGVWAVDELGGAQQRDQAWLLERADSARIAAERAMTQPELHPDCVAFLGEEFQQLLREEVFARWAHAQRDDGDGEDFPGGDGFVAVDARALYAARAEGAQDEPGAAAGDSLERMWDANVNDDDRERVARLNAKLGSARQAVAEDAARPKAEVPPEVQEARADEAWRELGRQAQVPDEAMPRLLGMLREGTTIGRVAKEFGIKQYAARTWLEKLRDRGAARVEGDRSQARWLLADDDAPLPSATAAGRA